MTGSIVQITIDIVMIMAGSYLFVQNYRYWHKYGFNIYVYGFTAGASLIFLGCWVIITRFLLPEFFTLDSHTIDLLALSRRILYPVVLVYVVVTGYWQYFLNKS
jgi:hypothetical protein